MIVGFHVAELSPVMQVAVTTGATPVKLFGLLAVNVAVPTFVITPAVYPTALAGIAGPDVGVKAVEIALATHPDPAAALRASLTCGPTGR